MRVGGFGGIAIWRSLLRKVVVGVLVWHAGAAGAASFTAVEVFLQSGEPVAAWQFELGSRRGELKVVGVENGESEAFGEAPYFDREAVRSGRADRIVVADYSLAAPDELPTGRTRIATVHLMLEGVSESDLYLDLEKAVTPDGGDTGASLDMRVMTGREP